MNKSHAGASWRRLALLSIMALSLGGCASLKGPGSPGQKLDPWESWNRKVFGFNEKIDENVLKPVATAYSEVVPAPARLGVDNFFGNVSDAWSAVNLFLQGRLKTGVLQTMRFAVNTTLGFGGVLDISTEVGLERHSEDLGKTFGRWGTGTGAYIVWPVLGPSSVRDSFALPFDRRASPALLLDSGNAQFGITVLQAVNARSNFLRAGEMLDGIALDKYTFIRDAYLTRRGSFEEDGGDEYEVISPEPPSDPQAGS
ncbi:VacJ family lipoprotein [Paucibacter sp. PLA-PC-4]|uniref:MlaA family lipoprotein n=1 Tax=Paucibacter sp. PLA-PC-4 TaxID=2993655 RepID=UPI0022498D24|nr:VacJ family lipoprotein [Paucibacter sp. PLA-PC-4]MCX2861367.1 VacJ family lipoprotein [Paucibacter sp. PLA-PC-4]